MFVLIEAYDERTKEPIRLMVNKDTVTAVVIEKEASYIYLADGLAYMLDKDVAEALIDDWANVKVNKDPEKGIMITAHTQLRDYTFVKTSHNVK